MQSEVRWTAPAKVNLGLIIHGRDPASGRHPLSSFMATVAWGDTLTVSQTSGAPDLDLRCEPPLPGRNLVDRAWEFWVAQGGEAGRLRVQLEKRIPVAAGMGGGSSDAGTLLRALANLLHAPPRPWSEIVQESQSLGADVPFFASGAAAAWVSGFGERLETLPPLPPFPVLLVHPAWEVATPRVYAAYDGLAESAAAPVALSAYRDTVLALYQGKAPTAPMRNDLEPAAVAAYPALQGWREVLEAASQPWPVHFSGSGATYYILGPLNDPDAVVHCRERLQQVAPWVQMTRFQPPLRGDSQWTP